MTAPKSNSADESAVGVQPLASSVLESYPLSPMQQGMLFHALLESHTGVDVEQLVCDLHERVDVSSLKRAWESVIARHEVLRTCFRWTGRAEPLQEVHPQIVLPWERHDWRGRSAEEQERCFVEFLQADRHRGFAMDSPPLLRLTLIQCDEDDYRLIWTFHHALLDGRSFVVLLREVFGFYEAFCKAQNLELPLPRPYRDYISWLQQQDFSKSEDFWRQSLRGFASPTPLTVDRVASSWDKSGRLQDVRHICLPAEISSALRSLAQQHELTLNTLVQGAWALLLGRYSGEHDVVFGAARACRHSSVVGAENMVGLFINTLPVRVRPSPEEMLLPWLRQLRAQWVAMREHEQTPLVRVQGWSEVPRGTALFDSIVVFENYDLNTLLRTPGGDWASRQFQLFEQPGYPIALAAYSGAELLLKIGFDSHRFADITIQRMLGHLRTLLEAMTAQPQRRLGELPMLTAAERQQLLVDWNATGQEFAKGDCLQDLFEAQVKRTPDAVAVVFEDRRLTYDELNAYSNHLAHDLRAAGVGPDVLVGLYLERSIDLVIGLFGILKAGGAYVPLDPSYPTERLGFMLAEAKPAAILTQQTLLSTLAALNSPRAICLDKINWRRAGSTNNPGRISDAENLAYVLFTSGSTGKPKGAMIPHRAIVNHMRWMQSAFPMGEHDIVFQKTPFSFDASVWEFFAPLFTGGQLLLARPDGQRDPVYLVDTIRQRGVTILQVVPTLLRMLLEVPDFKNCRSLRHVFCGGEALDGELAAKFFRTLPARLHNLYGPTEVTIDSVFYSVPPDDLPEFIPIGRPVANTQAYVLDAHGQQVPVGVAGELYLGGAQVGRGYLNRPELTAERFLPDSFRPDMGTLLYKTGDKVRYLADGTIEFLGRVDHQVKIRGFRIELGEIEAVLRQCAGVRECVVVAREDVPGEKRLVAYLAGRPEELPPTAELRRLLQRQLPEFMVPTAFVGLETLPQTPNGKVDRRALPAPSTAQTASRESLVAPRDAVEERLVSIWQATLGVQPIGVTDNFFHLGGDSLQAVRLFAHIEDVFQTRLPLALLFQSPTIERLAVVLRSQKTEVTWSSLVPIQTDGSKPPLFCVHARGGNVLFYRNLATRLGSDQPVYAFQAQGLNRRTQFITRVEDMAALYIREMKTVQPKGPYFLAGSSFGGLGAYEMAHQLLAAGDAVALLALFDTAGPDYPKMIPALPLTNHWHLAQNCAHRFRRYLRVFVTLKRGERIAFLREKFGKKFTRWQIQLASRLPAQLVAKLFPAYVDMRAHELKLMRSIDVAVATYRHRPYPGRLTLFRASKQPSGICLDPTLGWDKIVSGELEIHEVPGSHGMLGKEPGMSVLVELLKACIADAQTRGLPSGVFPVRSDHPANAAEPGLAPVSSTSTGLISQSQ